MAAAALTAEQRELNLVEKVDYRIIYAANDEEKLQSVLGVYLAPLLLKAGSEHASVRNLVLQIVARIKTFIQPPGIVLPVGKLLDQFKSTENALIQHLDSIFILHSVHRLDAEEQAELLPAAFRGIGGKVTPKTRHLFHAILHMLPALKIPPRGSKEDEGLRERLGLSDPKDAEFVAQWLGRLLLLKQTPGESHGLSVEDLGFLTLDSDTTWLAGPGAASSKLPETRVRALSFLASGAFTDEERFLPAICAAASLDKRLSSVGDDLLKRSAASLESPALVARLFRAHEQLPTPHRARILGLLSKSAEATTHPDEIKAVIAHNMELLQSHLRSQQLQRRQDGDGDVQMAGTSLDNRPPIGLEWMKLQTALFEFINWVSRIGPTKGEFVLGEALLEHLQGFIREQGWPRPTMASPEQLSLRSRAYETIGELAKTARLNQHGRGSLLGFLFRSLSEDPSQVATSVEGALFSMSIHFNPSNAMQNTPLFLLHSILLTYVTASDDADEIVRSTRYAAVKCANQFLPFSDTTARWIDILAASGARDKASEVIEEGERGLDPWTYFVNSSYGDNANGGDVTTRFPNWIDMVQTYFTETIQDASNQATRWSGQSPQAHPHFANFHGHNRAAYPYAVEYCTRILVLTALKGEIKIANDWLPQLENKARSDLRARGILRRLFSEPRNATALYTLLSAGLEGVLTFSGADNAKAAETCARCMVDVASVAPKAVVRSIAGRAFGLVKVMSIGNPELRALAARLYGILVPQPANSQGQVVESIEGLVLLSDQWRAVVGSDLVRSETAFLFLAHGMSRAIYYSSPVARLLPSLYDTLPKPEEVSSASPSSQDAFLEALTQLWTAGIDGLPTRPDREEGAKAWVDVLFAMAKKGNERAITAMGRLAVALREADASDAAIIGSILDKFYELYELKQAEVHFAIGEAITATVAGWESDAVQLTLDVEAKEPPTTGEDDDDSGDVLAFTTPFRVPKRSTHLNSLLDKLLQDCKSTKPALLKASGIWLFCLIQHCSHLPEIQSKLRESQAAFMRLLNARNELVQETASRGLSLVFEKGDAELRQALSNDLVRSFTGEGEKIKVDQDTELFEEGALPTGEGKSITSYKDIVNLANEVGDQSLIYKFMALATNAATWQARSAFGRFGLSSILSESEVDPKLYPKLYRYRFDPNKNVQRSMNDIWKALVPNSGKVISKNFDAIMQDLLKSVLGREWRVREASCAAISELIGGQKFTKYEKYYTEIWAVSLKVLDDVKGSVRAAAAHLCINLSETLVRHLKESGGAGDASTTATAMMGEALPFLLSEKGIESGVKEVQMIAITTVMEIARYGGKALKPFIADMIPLLLNLLSTVEPQAINYYYQRAKEDAREKLDKMRSAAVSQSPISEAIEDALRSVDAETMPALLKGLEATIKSAIGMPTKIGCSRLLSTLATRHGSDFAPHAGRFLQLMEKYTLEANDEVSQGYAKAAAYLVRVASPESRDRFARHCVAVYFAAEDERRRQKVADAVLMLSKVSPDHFAALEAGLLPLAYLGSHDTDGYVEKAFAEVWGKHAGSARSVARYVPEIVELVGRALGDPKWALKHAGALAAGDMVKALAGAAELSGGSGGSGSSSSAGQQQKQQQQIPEKTLQTVWPVFEQALALKTFEGKEKVLAALPELVERGRVLWSSTSTSSSSDAAAAAIATKLRKIAIREAKRNNDVYRVHALAALWKVAKARDDLDMLDEIVEVATAQLDVLRDEDDEESSGNRMDVDSGGAAASQQQQARRTKEALVAKTAANALEAVARGYSQPGLKADPEAVLGRVLAALKPYLESAKFDRVRRDVWYTCVVDLMNDAAAATAAAAEGDKKKGAPQQQLALGYLATLDIEKSDVGTEEQRSNRAKASVAIAKALRKGVFGEESSVGAVWDVMRGGLQRAVAEERSMDVQKFLKDALAEIPS